MEGNEVEQTECDKIYSYYKVQKNSLTVISEKDYRLIRNGKFFPLIQDLIRYEDGEIGFMSVYFNAVQYVLMVVNTYGLEVHVTYRLVSDFLELVRKNSMKNKGLEEVVL